MTNNIDVILMRSMYKGGGGEVQKLFSRNIPMPLYIYEKSLAITSTIPFTLRRSSILTYRGWWLSLALNAHLCFQKSVSYGWWLFVLNLLRGTRFFRTNCHCRLCFQDQRRGLILNFFSSFTALCSSLILLSLSLSSCLSRNYSLKSGFLRKKPSK